MERRPRNAEFSEAAYDAPLHYSLGIREWHTTIARECGHRGAAHKPTLNSLIFPKASVLEGRSMAA
jgi:hypothetical protein